MSHATTSVFIAHLAVFDARELYLGEGCSSIFTYCTRVLHFSESAAQNRITVARLVQRFPAVLDGLGDGSLTLTALRLLSTHLRTDNAAELLGLARHASKHDIQKLIATLAPRADVAFSIRRLSSDRTEQPFPPGVTIGLPEGAKENVDGVGIANTVGAAVSDPAANVVNASADSVEAGVGNAGAHIHPADESRSASAQLGSTSVQRTDPGQTVPLSHRLALRIVPLSPGRYRLQFTAGESFIARLDEARNLCRHQVPDGDRTTILEMALVRYVEFLRQRRFGGTERKRGGKSPAAAPSAGGEPPVLSGLPVELPAQHHRRKGRSSHRSKRRIAVAVRREVWRRDEGRCTFHGPDGMRCNESGFVEFHHVVPFALGGSATMENIVLRCRAHNQYEGRLVFGPK
ncbi:MAG TPA: hypothetical protein VF720_01385 [Candidatus Eisenbacteria bacterium]